MPWFVQIDLAVWCFMVFSYSRAYVAAGPPTQPGILLSEVLYTCHVLMRQHCGSQVWTCSQTLRKALDQQSMDKRWHSTRVEWQGSSGHPLAGMAGPQHLTRNFFPCSCCSEQPQGRAWFPHCSHTWKTMWLGDFTWPQPSFVCSHPSLHLMSPLASHDIILPFTWHHSSPHMMSPLTSHEVILPFTWCHPSLHMRSSNLSLCK